MTMQRYVEQLISDLKQAQKNTPPEPDFGNTYEEFEAKMLEIENSPNVNVKKKYGVSFEELPTSDKLTQDQMILLTNTIEETWIAHGISVDLFEEIPDKLKYELFRDYFDEVNHPIPGYANVYGFCSGWCPDCEIVDYCTTKDDTWTKEELEEERKKASIKKDES